MMSTVNTCSAAVILAGGLGLRLRPFSLAIPKPLMPVGEKALIETQIARFVQAGIRDIYIATNYKGDYLQRFLGDGSQLGVSIYYSQEVTELGTAGPLDLLRDRLPETFFVINGDILSTEPISSIVDFHATAQGNFTVAVKSQSTPYNFGQILLDSGKVIGIEEKPILHTNIVAGMYIANRSILDFIPKGKKFGMDQLIAKLLSENLTVNAYILKDYWIDIGQIDTLSAAQSLSDQE
jgi:NDP-sugar pyrophosphorylase family protein